MIQDTSNQDVRVAPKSNKKKGLFAATAGVMVSVVGYLAFSGPTADVSLAKESLKVHTVQKMRFNRYKKD